MIELEVGQYLMVPEKRQNRVVRVHELDDTHVVLREAEGAGVWTLARADIETRLRDGYIQPVVPRWEPAGEEVPV